MPARADRPSTDVTPPSPLARLGPEELIRHMPVAAMIVDASSGRIVHANARVRHMIERQLGRTVPSVLHGSWDIFHPDGRPYRMEEWPLVRSMATGEEVVNEDYFNVLPDGSRLYVRCSSAPIHDDGRIVGGLLVMDDVTEEKRAEDARAYHEILVDNVADAVVGTDPEFRLTVWNEGAERLYGFTADEVLGRDARDVASYSGDQSRRELEQELLETDRTRTEITAYRKDGARVEVEIVSVAVRDGERQIIGYLGIHRDISARKWAEEELRLRSEQQALVARLGLQALASDDLDAVMREAVTLVAATLGVELTLVAELLAGTDAIRVRVGVGWRDGVVGGLTEAAAAGSEWSYALASRRPVVSEDLGAEARFTPSPLALEHGAVSGVDVVIQGTQQPFGLLGAHAASRRAFSESDVNFMQAVANVLAMAVQRVEYENRILDVRDNERRRIARDLHDEALQDLTEALAQASGTLPGAGGAEQRLDRLAPALGRVASQLRGAIYDLRLAGEENRPFPELLATLVELQRAMTADGDIQLDVGDGIPATPLGQSGTEILRVVGEAIVNARRHAHARHIRVVATGSAKQLSVEVSDDGRGFDTATALTAAHGSGVEGMRERAALLDADLRIRSDPGAGTRVRLTVPLGRRRGTLDETARVLLVEDHTAVREAIAARFDRERGFEVVAQAGSLAEARTLLDEHVDVAVVDLGLPDGDGSDLIRDLRATNPRAHALVLSASLDRAQVARAVESGASAVLDKTAHLDEVVDTVRRLRAGETVLGGDAVVALLGVAGSEQARDLRALECLTPRERDVLQALAEGLDSHAIADRLQITIRTQRNHVANILAKLGVHSQLQAVLVALRYGAVKGP